MQHLVYLLKRITYLIPVLLLISFLVFGMTHILPGDPADILLGGEDGVEDPVVRAVLIKELGLDRPIIIQYAIWLWRALHGNFGKSIYSHEEVFTLILSRFPATLILAIASVIVSVMIALPAGIIAAVNRRKFSDYTAMFFALLGVSVPQFWAGIMLILMFSLWLGWLPSMGFVDPFKDLIGSVKYIILPATALGLRMAGVVTRMTRSSMLDELSQDYVRTARAKGLSERAVIFVHTLKNAMIPTVTILGLQFGHILGGSIVIEQVFSWPGVGQLLVEAIFTRDYLVVQAAIMLITVAFVLVNLLVDFIYTWLNPRITLE
jgi:peptide/nickel transport system permease protein